MAADCAWGDASPCGECAGCAGRRAADRFARACQELEDAVRKVQVEFYNVPRDGYMELGVEHAEHAARALGVVRHEAHHLRLVAAAHRASLSTGGA